MPPNAKAKADNGPGAQNNYATLGPKTNIHPGAQNPPDLMSRHRAKGHKLLVPNPHDPGLICAEHLTAIMGKGDVQHPLAMTLAGGSSSSSSSSSKARNYCCSNITAAKGARIQGLARSPRQYN
jgi:hypothetical protein